MRNARHAHRRAHGGGRPFHLTKRKKAECAPCAVVIGGRYSPAFIVHSRESTAGTPRHPNYRRARSTYLSTMATTTSTAAAVVPRLRLNNATTRHDRPAVLAMESTDAGFVGCEAICAGVALGPGPSFMCAACPEVSTRLQRGIRVHFIMRSCSAFHHVLVRCIPACDGGVHSKVW